MRTDPMLRKFYPETNISGFSHVDGTVSFYSQIAAIIRPTDTVLDFGAGRGELLSDDQNVYRRGLCNLRGRCAHLDGCDLDSSVLGNPYLDAAKTLEEGVPLPYEDKRFDLIVARYVFEHIANPAFVAGELLRVLKPGGVIAATTPNKWGYISASARLIPSRIYLRVLARSQPQRKPEDVFPTQYRLNTPRALRKYFAGHEVFIVPKAAEPAYYFDSRFLFKLLKFANKHTPDSLLPVLDVYVRKGH